MLDRTDLPGSCPVPAHLTTLGVSPRPATPLLRTPHCPASAGDLGRHVLGDLVQRRRPVDLRLSRPQRSQIGPVQQK
ncbi:hypothetical protein Ae505Ps2_4175 [Pseudonocardia sp. Ae505_Ps2]|nr:hypothetical protein Ae505Ps2_4175 [Pseudonocardia sp. Ae505_Ps2]